MSRVVNDTPATSHFHFIYGQFALSQWKIPYFTTTMTLREAAQTLKLATDFPGAESIKWRLDELYQRDVDWPRVERKIVPYLNDRSQPQFFNALTIALLPLGSQETLASSFSDSESWSPPELNRKMQKELTVGPFRAGYWDDWKSIDSPEARTGLIRWNPNQVFAVAIDGQHRLAAIQQIGKSAGGAEDPLASTSVPVILILLDPQFGYEAPEHSGLLDVLRRIFIDLNKHAKSVSRARQILLDDKDPISICTRAALEDHLSDDLCSLMASPPRLPLSLIDWHTEQGKFDDGPYITTILGLDWAIGQCLGTKSISDFTNYSEVNRQLKALEQSLELDLRSARERLEDLQQVSQEPFSFLEGNGADELGHIRRAFTEIWNPALVHLFTKLRPYRELIDRRGQHNALDAEFSNWFSLYVRKQRDSFGGKATDDYKTLLGRLARRKERPIGVQTLEQRLEEIEAYKVDNLAFNVAFQRAYIYAFIEFLKVEDRHIHDLAPDEEDFDVEELYDFSEEDENIHTEPRNVSVESTASFADRVCKRAEEFVTAINDLISDWPEFLDVNARYAFVGEEPSEYFWQGTLRKAEGGIDFTQGASVRASEILFWIAAMHTYDRVTDPDRVSDFADLKSGMETGQGNFTKRLMRSARRFADKDTSAAGRILSARDETFEQGKAREEAWARMRHLWQKMGL